MSAKILFNDTFYEQKTHEGRLMIFRSKVCLMDMPTIFYSNLQKKKKKKSPLLLYYMLDKSKFNY
jgi:hypothetical protein